MRLRRSAGFALLIALSSCSREVPPQAAPTRPEDGTANEASPEPMPKVEPDAGATPTTRAPADPSVEPQEPPPDLPLDKGVYVLADSDCRNPANAGFRVWDGKGLSGSATRACVASPVVLVGQDYTVEQTCTDTYSSNRSMTTIKLRITDPRHFTILGGAMAQGFHLCPADQVPDWLREKP